MKCKPSKDEILRELASYFGKIKDFNKMREVKKLATKYRNENNLRAEEMESLNKMFKEYKLSTKE